MPRVSFEELPDHGRLWIFPADRDLTEDEAGTLLDAVDDFLGSWSAHGALLKSGRALLEQRFLLVGVDVDAEAPSGCSIDALVNRLRGLGAELGVRLIDHGPVWHRTGNEIRSVSRSDFRAMANSGALDAEVPVFDTTLTTIGAWRSGGLERPAARSWHGKAFFGVSAGD